VWSGPKVVLENYIGLEYHDARIRALRSGLWLLFADPDHPPQGMCIVTRQEPAAGTELERQSEVRAWVKDVSWEGDGPSGGAREPRRPRPGHDDDLLALVERETEAD
jgi:hypothetical protein